MQLAGIQNRRVGCIPHNQHIKQHSYMLSVVYFGTVTTMFYVQKAPTLRTDTILHMSPPAAKRRNGDAERVARSTVTTTCGLQVETRASDVPVLIVLRFGRGLRCRVLPSLFFTRFPSGALGRWVLWAHG